MDGIRTSKTVNGVTTTYTLVGDRVAQESDGTNNIYYRYDNVDSLISMNLNGTVFYYVRNAQDDIIGLTNVNGDVVVQYAYDAWGRIVSSSDSTGLGLATKNSYRYRGYLYDVESGLYYLNSRYFSPDLARMINADQPTAVDVNCMHYLKNLYTYCDNNPVMKQDASGYYSAWGGAAWTGTSFQGGNIIGTPLLEYT